MHLDTTWAGRGEIGIDPAAAPDGGEPYPLPVGPDSDTRASHVPTGTRWRTRYRRGLLVIDLIAALLGCSIGLLVRFASNLGAVDRAQIVVAVVLPFAWLCCAAMNRAYEPRLLGAGTGEYERCGHAFLQLVAITTFVAYVSHADLSRGFVLLALMMILVLCVAGRLAARKVLHRRRRLGRATTRVLAVGDASDIVRFDETLRANSDSGLRLAAACVLESSPEHDATLADRGVERVEDLDSLCEAAQRVGAQSIAVVSPTISSERLRWIAWQIEGTNTDLVLLPGLTEVAGRRLSIQQAGGLNLLYVAIPELRGPRRWIKGAFDRIVAVIALAVLAPALLFIAAVVSITSRGPALFVQTRVGKDGKTFRMIKFRSMCRDAERRLVDFVELNEATGGPLFKIRQDPRVTRFGKLLRRYSLDEIPQLFNVVTGSMSLVGPRPPLPQEVAAYGGEVHRRLLVKPGMTGLWQISGRSDLTWEESVRIDLRYVENWSLSLDMIVLARTVVAVVRPRGAY